MYLDILSENLEQKKQEEERKAVAKEKQNEKNLIHDKIKQDKFNDIFYPFYKFVSDIKNQKSDVFSLMLKKYEENDNLFGNDYIKASLMGFTIAVKPIDINIIDSLTKDNKIYVAIDFEPHENIMHIEEINWSIDDAHLCSYTSENTNFTEPETFCIPEKVFFGMYSKNKDISMVKKSVTPFKYNKYYYGIEIEFNESSNEYTIKTLRNRIIASTKIGLNLTNNKFCFLNITSQRYMYDSLLNIKIKKDEFKEKQETIFEDFLRIFISKTEETKILTFENIEKQKFSVRPFNLNKEYWDQPHKFLLDKIITDFPRYMAYKIQQSNNLKKLNRESFEYNFKYGKYS